MSTRVPWFNREEWNSVRKKVLSKKLEDLEHAMSRMLVWKARCEHQKSPVYMDATVYLLRAIILDEKMKQNTSNCSVEIVSAYGEGINKFVQLVIDRVQKTLGKTNKVVAEDLGIPGWVIDVRNDVIHQFRSSLELLRTATSVLLEWLKTHYWTEEKREIDNSANYRENKVKLEKIVFGYFKVALNKSSKIDEKLHSSFLDRLRTTIKSEPKTVIKYLVQSEALFATSVERSGDSDVAELLFNAKRAWLPIFYELRANLTTFFEESFAYYQTDNVLRRKTTMSQVTIQTKYLFLWFEFILSEKCTYKDEALVSYLDLKRILIAVTKVVSPFTTKMIEQLMPRMEPGLDEQKQRTYFNMYAIYSGKFSNPNKTAEMEDYRPKKVEDLVNYMATKVKGQKGFKRSRCINWGSVPIGELPDSTSLNDLSLKVEELLPVNVQTEEEELLRLEENEGVQQVPKDNIPEFKHDAYKKLRREFREDLGGFWNLNLPTRVIGNMVEQDSSFVWRGNHQNEARPVNSTPNDVVVL